LVLRCGSAHLLAGARLLRGSRGVGRCGCAVSAAGTATAAGFGGRWALRPLFLLWTFGGASLGLSALTRPRLALASQPSAIQHRQVDLAFVQIDTNHLHP